MTTRPLPSLDLLRGFESAARHLSVTKAAAELFVTQSAVSRQIRSLEEALGVALFERGHRQIRLTAAGEELQRAATDALRLLADAAARIGRRGAGRTVTLSCTIGFASLWLVPRLADLREALPGLDLRLSANNRLIDVDRERIELAIRYGPASLAPAGAVRLFGEHVFPVCSPALLRRKGRPLAGPADLRHHVLLVHDDEESRRPSAAWQVWLETVRLRDFAPAAEMHFSHYDQLIQAAVDGHGVALGVSPLVRRLVEQGRLVVPFARRFASPRAYYLITGREAAARPEVLALTGWLLQQAGDESLAAAGNNQARAPAR